MAKMSLELGRMNWRPVRNFVNQMIAEGHDLNIWEGEGFLSRPFVISGSDIDVETVYRSLKQWDNTMKEAEK